MLFKTKLVLATIVCCCLNTSSILAQPSANPADYITLYPGVYSDKEQEPVAAYIAEIKAIKERGPLDVQALVNDTLPAGTPGVGPKIKATREWIEYNNSKYDPDNKLLNIDRVAKKYGYESIFAFPAFAAHDDTFMKPWPPQARDTLLVSDLNHEIEVLAPIYPGDTLFLVADDRDFVDLTPAEGSIYRHIAIQTKGSIYNQDGIKVNSVIFRVTESLKVYKDGLAPENPGFPDIWEAPNWLARPAYVYTDADWNKIKTIWKHEKPRGKRSLYWGDVKVGDTPNVTLDGPIAQSVTPTPHWGMGSGGSKTLKSEFLNKKSAKQLTLNEDTGLYTPSNVELLIPTPPSQESNGTETEAGAIDTAEIHSDEDSNAVDTQEIHKDNESRSPLINYMGREYAIRHLYNWMGYEGKLKSIKWSIMDPKGHANYGKDVPVSPFANRYLSQLPEMKDKYVNSHGLTRDLAIVQSKVINKYVQNDEFRVDLIWWIETIQGDIWQEGYASVALPTK